MKNFTQQTKHLPLFPGIKAFSLLAFLFFCGLNLQASTVAFSCANNGGDADNDGICDDKDNCDQYNPEQADYDLDGIGDLCDTSHDCDGITSIKRVKNLASACSGADGRIIWIEGAYCKEIGDLYFVEYDNGTATLKGSVKEVDGGNVATVDITFTGKTNNGKPYEDCATLDYTNDWYYYENFFGTIGGYSVTPNPDHNFQVGIGANVKNDAYGASGWFHIDGKRADFNFELSEALTCQPAGPPCDDVLVHWNLDDCLAYSDAYSYDEFTPGYPSACPNVSATNVYRDNASSYYHSCLDGQSGKAMCISGTYVDYVPNSSVHKLKFSTTLEANTTLSGLTFYQKSESTILNIGQTNEVANNYLKKYSVRVKINGSIVFESNNNSTSQSGWSLASLDFSGVPELTFTETTTVDFELLGYKPANNGASMRAWELDEIKILGCCAAPITGSIGDFVWEDKDADGVQDDTEPGIPGVFVFLEDEFGNDVPGVMYQVTGPNGEYSFDNLPLGKYVVKFATPSGFVLTDQNKGGDDDKDSDASILDGKSEVIMLTETNPDVTNIDAGYGVPIKLTGYVWVDENQDGFQDDTELPKEGVRVFLIDAGDDMLAGTADDTQVGFVFTDGAGIYTFHNVQPGKYYINFDLSPLVDLYVFTEPDFVADDFKDSDADVVTGDSPVFMLNAFSPSSGVDAGIILASNLPVELISFGAKKSNCFTALNWATSVELDFSHFEVEHSTDGKNYKRINTTRAQGGSGIQHYYYTDKNTAATNYYRLKMIDLDGSYEYSDALNINHDCNSTFGLSIFPNPVNKYDGEVSVKFFSEVEATSIHIVDAMGRIVRSQEFQVSLEWNVENLDVSDLQSGLYYIMIDGNRNAARFMIAE